MASSSFALCAIALLLVIARSQDCYYPSGDLSTGSSRESPCSANGICCPESWQCMSNGLCYYPPDDFYGRYSCTDPTWATCPDICTYNYTALGGEAILKCSNGEWCCDGNRSGDCCNEDDTTYFALPDPKSVTSITGLASVTSPGSTVNNAHKTNTDAAPTPSTGGGTTSSSPTSASPSVSPAAVTHETTTTGKDGSVRTVTEVTTELPSGTGSGASQGHTTSSPGSNLGLIVGLAVGIPFVLLLAGILLFISYRRKQKSRYAHLNTRPRSPPMVANYGNIPPGTHAPELAGYPVADTRDKHKRTSELSGNDTYIYSPTVSNRTSDSSPPTYSPGAKNSATAQAKSPPMVQIPEEPQELWGGYVPYRPPQAQLAPETRPNGENGRPAPRSEQPR